MKPSKESQFSRLKGKITREVGSIWLKPLIRKKWERDQRELPLSDAHRNLYFHIHRTYWNKFQHFPDLVNGRDANDRIQWLKLFDQREDLSDCIDKIKVRDFVAERIGEDYLIELYQTHDSFSEIDFDALPKSFVIKANHDSGSVILVRDKAEFDYGSAKEKIDAALERSYGLKNGQWAYNLIKPKVLVEEFIDPQDEALPPDYKFFCVDGTARFVQHIHNRGANTRELILDLEGRELGITLTPRYKRGENFTKPESWDQMIPLAEQLSTGFKFVRVDLFNTSKQQIYAGEMTFWPAGGFFKGGGQKQLGKYLDFDRTTFRPPIATA